MAADTQFSDFLFSDASIAFDYASFTFSGGLLETYLDTQEFFGNGKIIKCPEFEVLAGLGHFRLLETLHNY